MVGKILEMIKNRPKLFGQKGKWDWPRDKPIATIPAVESIISGPSKTVHPARAFLRQVFPPYDRKLVESFMTRFEGQRKRKSGFMGMSIFEVEGLLGGIGQRRKGRRKSKPTVHKGKGIPMKIIG